MDSIIYLSVNNIQLPADPPEILEVSSSKGASSECPDCMGVYKLSHERCPDNPVWEHTGREMYVYLDADGDWLVSDEVGDDSSYSIASRSSNLPSPHAIYARWWYYSHGEWNKDDDTLRIQSISEGFRLYLEKYWI